MSTKVSGRRIGADVADGQRLPLLFQNEFDAAGQVFDGARRDGAGQTHAMVASGTLEGLVFGDGVVVGLAFAVAEPSQEGQGDYDDANANAEFSTSLHKSPLMEWAPTEIVTYPEAGRYGTSVGCGGHREQ